MGNVLLINPSYQPSYGGAKYGLIRSFDWDEYFIYTTKPLFAHKTLSYEAIQQYVELAHRKAIQNPAFWARRRAERTALAS